MTFTIDSWWSTQFQEVEHFMKLFFLLMLIANEFYTLEVVCTGTSAETLVTIKSSSLHSYR